MFELLREICRKKTASFSYLKKLKPNIRRTTFSDNLGILNAAKVLIIEKNEGDKRERNYSVNWTKLTKAYLDYFKEFAPSFYFSLYGKGELAENSPEQSLKFLVEGIFIDQSSITLNIKKMEQVFLTQAIIDSYSLIAQNIADTISKSTSK